MSILLFLSTALALTLSLIREIAKRGEDSLAVTVWKFLAITLRSQTFLSCYGLELLLFLPHRQSVPSRLMPISPLPLRFTSLR